MVKVRSVRGEWDSYDRGVLPRDAPAVQRLETRRAFYAGAWAMLCMVRDIGEDSVSADQGVATLEALRKECEAFARDIGAGRA